MQFHPIPITLLIATIIIITEIIIIIIINKLNYAPHTFKEKGDQSKHYQKLFMISIKYILCMSVINVTRSSYNM